MTLVLERVRSWMTSKIKPTLKAFASMRDVSEKILRLIGTNRNFNRDYDVTLPLVVRLRDRELKELTLNRNVPSVLRLSATKILKAKQGSH